MNEYQERYPTHWRYSCEELCYDRQYCPVCGEETTHWFDDTDPEQMHCVECEGYPMIFEVQIGKET